ncbi:DNA double-strand break repair nuclease NurA [Salirhabdus sp. Marseille-P4669]|uniref:DNA double-strand break repair nuclease NurA n=1 Tax=Salirhabdus sp. Marseille-P4669 TaxID=2042310 RepID=UPI000C7DCBE2|nr:DNA double-strand break repair nuclease NurA [Salirhabdus sp. Marseille-P4669]
MGYMSRAGRRPNEYASKTSHSNIINELSVKSFLEGCSLPKGAKDISLSKHKLIKLQMPEENKIKNIVAIDGGYTELKVKTEFPSSTISFFQFGALIFNTEDLNEISNKSFIDPQDISKLKNIQRFKFTLPTKNITLETELDLIDSVRKSLYDFFVNEPFNDKNDRFIKTLKWFIFEEYNSEQKDAWSLASCPKCGHRNIKLEKSKMDYNYTYICPNDECKSKIFLTDVFRLHEAIDNELGASGILGYLTSLLEQFILIHLIRIMLKIKNSLLEETLFLKDGPLAFFGQTANLHKPMRTLINYLHKNYALNLAGLEKSGLFVEHAHEISNKLGEREALLLDNDYIYKYITPGKANDAKPYGSTSYYSSKLIFKAIDGRVYVITLPTERSDVVLNPNFGDFKNAKTILQNIELLKCDMYENGLIPIALVNKLVSLSNHPSSTILSKFARDKISN